MTLLIITAMQELLKETKTENNYTVSQLSQLIRGVLENNFNNIHVTGEIAEITYAKSGHVYFTIKDENAVLNVICWRTVFQTMKIRLDVGMEVICRGKISSYPQRSNYQFILSGIEISGDGVLMKIFNERKAKLEKLGVFDDDRKKPIPIFPQSICVITSETGAVIRDILHRIRDRFPLKVYLYHCQVQGSEAHFGIRDAINAINNSDIKPDTLIVARGGGSMQDLWPFNEEEVAMAVANSKIPIISAVGHETDFTLCDFAADLRAPTPTAAAEFATPNRVELLRHNANIFNGVKVCINRLLQMIQYQLNEQFNRYHRFAHSLQQRSQECALHHQRIQSNTMQKIDRWKSEIASLERVLNTLNPEHVLDRGYAIVRQEGAIVSAKSDLKVDKKIEIQFKDGIVDHELR